MTMPETPRASYRATLRALEPGDVLSIKHSSDRPYDRTEYRRINGAAHDLWGPGTYRLIAGHNETIVQRLEHRKAPANA